MTKRTCPKCGHELVFKYGVYGQFIGCSNYPACNFTMNEDGSLTKRQKEVVEWDEQGKPTSYGYTPVVKPKTKRKCPLGICDGSGLLPFTGKDGKVRGDVHLFCSCHPDYGDNVHEYDRLIKPEDYDFACSESFRAYQYNYCGIPDPGAVTANLEPEKPEPQVIEHIHRTSNLSKQEWDLLQQTKLKVDYLEKKIEEAIKPKAKQKKPSGYKGLDFEATSNKQ